MKVLIGCEFSGRVRDEFARRGHCAMSCDYLPSETSGLHRTGDVIQILDWGWDLAIFHPPCTRLCNSGVRWLAERGLWSEMWDAADFFKTLLLAPIPKIAIENPIPHKYALERIGVKYDQIIQPWMFGDGETKATCLWLKNLPRLVPTEIVKERLQRIHLMPPSKDRSKERSRTYSGIAKAMAEQWG